MSSIRRAGSRALTQSELLDLAIDPVASRDEQAWLEALPVATALIGIDAGELRLGGHNRAFARVLDARRDRAHLCGLFDAIRHPLVTGTACAPFAWTEPGAGGRHFQAHVALLDADAPPGRRAMLTLLDRTAAIETERSLRFEMLHDSLTGLPNRLAFVEAIDAALDSEEGGQQFAVIALDLVRFSRVNESIGAMAGDELIITVARRVLAAVRPSDLLARTSGDEFSILLRLDGGPGDVLHTARRVQAALATPINLSELEIRVDGAIGCALWHEAGATSADLLQNAQFALKRAKLSRRIEIYRPDEARLARRRFSLETELRRAIDRDELSLAFQPLVRLDRGGIAGFEALARWQHPDRGAIAPIEFITVAEESGLILPLGRWVLDKALATLAEWDAKLGGAQACTLSVNVSPVQLQRDQVALAVEGALGLHGIAGERLTLELTESSIIADPDRAAGVLDALQALSCRVAMDDFGTGYSNLAHLQRLPIDILKIDRSFVTDMLENRDSAGIVRAILGLASALGMSTVAEGIETLAVARTLAALGCDLGQGFVFARPLAADEAFARLAAPTA